MLSFDQIHWLPDLEKIYPPGSDLTLLNTYYQYPKYDPENHKKISDDFIILVYKDNKLGITRHQVIYKPDYIYYKLNDDEEQTEYPRLFIEKEKVHPIIVPFTKLEESIANETGNMKFFKDNLYSRNRAENKKLHMCTNIFFSDSSIESHYRFRFDQLYTNEPIQLKKGYLDIEIDNKYSIAELGDPSDSPINCVSFMDDNINKIYTFLLRNPKNPLIADFENKLKSKAFGFKQISEFLIDKIGGKEKADFFNVSSTTFDIMCDQTWEEKVVVNVIDQRNISTPEERGDFTFISGNTIFIDDFIQYASRRKSTINSYASLKLDTIGEIEADVKKLDYSHITHNISDLPYMNYIIFVLYNMIDVIVLKCIEQIVSDLDYITSKCIINNTPYNKGHRQTVYLVNRMAKDWFNKGFIIGNNVNKWNSKPPKFPGALVHDPLCTNNYVKQRINGRPISVLDNLQDYD